MYKMPLSGTGGGGRAFFRPGINIKESVTKFSGRNAGEQPDARIAAERQYREGDKLLLNVHLFENCETSVTFCQMLRVIMKEEGPYEYVRQFLELTETGEGKIIQNIFAVQRKMRGMSK